MKEALICISVYIGSIFLMSHIGKETPVVPVPVICVEHKEAPRTSKEEEAKPNSIDCDPNGNERSAPEAPKVAK